MRPITILLALFALLSPLALAQDTSTYVGEWLVIHEVDPFTDENSSFAGLNPVGASSYDDTAMLIRCDPGGSNVLEVFVSFDAYLGSGMTVPIMYRLDQLPPVTEAWSMSVSETAAFAPSPDLFARTLTRHQQLAIRAEKYDSSHVTLIFNLGNVQGVIDALACP